MDSPSHSRHRRPSPDLPRLCDDTHKQITSPEQLLFVWVTCSRGTPGQGLLADACHLNHRADRGQTLIYSILLYACHCLMFVKMGWPVVFELAKPSGRTTVDKQSHVGELSSFWCERMT